MATAQSIIDRAGKLLGVIESGESFTATESADALIDLNAIVSEWKADKSMTVTTLIEYASLATSQTLPDGYEQALAFNLALRFASEYQATPSATVIEIAAQSKEFIRRSSAATATTSAETIITKAIRLAGGLRVGEAPTAKELEYGLSTLNSMIGTWLANRDMKVVTLVVYATSATTQTLPSGYDNALTYNLALALSPQYQTQNVEVLAGLAKNYLTLIRRDAAPAVTNTGQALVNRALRMIGHIGIDENSTTTESNYVLAALNAMIDGWRNDRLMCYALQDESLTLVATDSSYTIGTGGQLNTTRPVSIESCYCRAGSIDYPVKIISFEDWNSIVDKTASSNIPECVYYEPTMATGTLQVWPVPNTANVLHLTTRVPLTALVLGTTVSLPPGWEDAIASNGAIAIAPEFQVEPSSAVVKMANDSLKGIKRVNSRPIMANTEMALMFGIQRSNIITDTP